MTDNQVTKILIEFFLDAFGEDAAGVGEWLAGSAIDVEVFISQIRSTHNELSETEV